MDYKQYARDMLKELVSIPSESGNEEAISKFIEKILSVQLGMYTERPSVGPHSYNIIGRSSENQKHKKKLILGGHIDTVPPAAGWLTNPYGLTDDGEKLRGLGAGDMKGGLAAQLTVLKMFHDKKILLDADIEFIGLADEERLSLGANWYKEQICLTQSSMQDTFCILAEPHFNNIVIGAAGKILYEITIHGRSGHASTPESGINAIDAACNFISSFNNKYLPLYQAAKCGSYCFLRIESDFKGYSLNIPDICTLLLNKQFTAKEDSHAFEEDLLSVYSSSGSQGRINLKRGVPSYASYRLSQNEPHLRSLCNFLADSYSLTPDMRINKGVSDANVIYTALNIPTVLFGPQGVNFHSENEYLEKASFFQYIDILFHYMKTVYTD